MKIETASSTIRRLLSAKDSAALDFTTIVSGYWSEDRYHGGHIAYQIARAPNGIWVMRSEVRNAVLDSVDEEDVREGRLNDDQLQALWGTTLEAAQDQRYHDVVAVAVDVAADVDEAEIADVLLKAVRRAGGAMVDEPD